MACCKKFSIIAWSISHIVTTTLLIRLLLLINLQANILIYTIQVIYNMNRSNLFYQMKIDCTILEYYIEGSKNDKFFFTMVFTTNTNKSYKLDSFGYNMLYYFQKQIRRQCSFYYCHN